MHSPTRSVFDTTGTLYMEGRWHSLGTKVVYAAENISLTVLETLIHGGGKKIPSRTVTRILIPDSIAPERVEWMELPASRSFGDVWVHERRSLLLRVPSIAVDKLEFNFILNPAHPDFPLVIEDRTSPFRFDERFVHLR